MTHGLDTSFLVAVEVSCHADHAAARLAADTLRRTGDRFAIAPQVLSEFVHIVGDPRRFTAPLTMVQALERAKSVVGSRGRGARVARRTSGDMVSGGNDETPTWPEAGARYVARRHLPKRRNHVLADTERRGLCRVRRIRLRVPRWGGQDVSEITPPQVSMWAPAIESKAARRYRPSRR